ncbi:MAG: hypothetical protein AAFU57_13840 [Bacteroidota bacterium]
MEAKPLTKKERELEKMLETSTFIMVWLMAAFSVSFGSYMLFF